MSLLLFAAFAQAAAMPPGPKIVFKEPARAAPVTGPIEALLVSPLYDQPFACVEHHDGQMDFTGDALGTDCMVVGGIEDGGFARLYRTDGKSNGDWYGWQATVYAPIDGKIVGLFPKEAVNQPGTLGKPPAGMIQIERADGVLVMLGHVASIRVKAVIWSRRGSRLPRSATMASPARLTFTSAPLAERPRCKFAGTKRRWPGCTRASERS